MNKHLCSIGGSCPFPSHTNTHIPHQQTVCVCIMTTIMQKPSAFHFPDARRAGQLMNWTLHTLNKKGFSGDVIQWATKLHASWVPSITGQCTAVTTLLAGITDSVLTVGYEINDICTCIYNHLLTQFWGPSEDGKQDYCKSWPNLQSRNYSRSSKIAFHTYHSLSLTTIKWGRLLVWGRVVKRHILECTTSQKGQTPHSVRVSYLSYTLCWRPLWKYRPLPRALVFSSTTPALSTKLDHKLN